MSSFWTGIAQAGGAQPASYMNGYGSSSYGGSSAPAGGYNLPSAATQYGQYAGQDRSAIAGGQTALNTSIQSAVNAGMPGLQQNLQSQKESDVRRGVSTGDLGTSFEGDITSAFQKNIANAAGQQALGLFNTQAGIYNTDSSNYLDLMAGNADRAQSASNAKTGFWNNLISSVGNAVGSHL